MQLLVPLHFACLELSLIVEFDYFVFTLRCFYFLDFGEEKKIPQS